MTAGAANYNSSATVYDPTGVRGPKCIAANYQAVDEVRMPSAYIYLCVSFTMEYTI